MARFSRWVTSIDSHTAGESTRLVTSGLPPIPGQTLAEKLAYANQQLAWAPGFLLLEPRGHKDMFGAVLLPACHPQADLGVLFMDNQVFEPMCGHATIGVVTSVLETGILPMIEPETVVTLDTASGLVRTVARVREGAVISVAFDNVPSFVYRRATPLQVPDLPGLTVDVVFGGLFFVCVRAEQVGVELIPRHAGRLAELGMRILAAARDQIPVQHPELPHMNRIYDLRFYTEPGSAGAASRNVVILGNQMVDRSPCGTGTSAETALRHAQGRLPVGASFVTESIIGTRFKGEVAAETVVGHGPSAFPAVIPRITGSAYITGFHQCLLAESDPFPAGFQLV